MKNMYATVLFLLTLTALPATAAEKVRDSEFQIAYATAGKYREIRENVELAITEQGLVINNVSHVADMLANTARDLGFTRQVYLHGEVFEFCSATLSREMTEADQGLIVLCPYTIQIWETPEKPGTIYVGYRRLPVTGTEAAQAVVNKINALLEKIVRAALSW
jgi:uncharacterized protein (DUF302 family)